MRLHGPNDQTNQQGQWQQLPNGAVELFPDGYAVRRGEFSIALSGGSELAAIRPVAVKLLHPIVADISDVNLSSGTERDADRIFKLSVARALRSELALVDSLLVKLLYPVVATIGNVNVALRIKGDALGIVELPVAGAGRSDRGQIFSAAVELDYVETALERINVGDVNVAAGVESDTLRLNLKTGGWRTILYTHVCHADDLQKLAGAGELLHVVIVRARNPHIAGDVGGGLTRIVENPRANRAVAAAAKLQDVLPMAVELISLTVLVAVFHVDVAVDIQGDAGRQIKGMIELAPVDAFAVERLHPVVTGIEYVYVFSGAAQAVRRELYAGETIVGVATSGESRHIHRNAENCGEDECRIAQVCNTCLHVSVLRTGLAPPFPPTD